MSDGSSLVDICSRTCGVNFDQLLDYELWERGLSKYGVSPYKRIHIIFNVSSEPRWSCLIWCWPLKDGSSVYVFELFQFCGLCNGRVEEMFKLYPNAEGEDG